MKISHNWLREFIKCAVAPAELSETLNMLGIEVESFKDYASTYSHFVIGYVEQCEKHPKADKLSICVVTDGERQYTVVCGAPNVATGQKIVFAKPGAVVPNGDFTIGVRTLRGVESNGMICSKTELNLGDESSGIWVLDDSFQIGMPLAEALGLNDVIYEISITPNRADALSHRGIARALSVYYDLPLTTPGVTLNESATPNNISIQLPDTSCPRYMARSMKNVKVVESPQWLKQRLEAVGIRPRNAVVDVTNYVLMECGHPLHAFDADTISGGSIIVKPAKSGDKFTTLDGKERELTDSMLMICDEKKYLAVAGVMGGENSAITMNTTNVLIESAMFAPSSIRKTARTLGINSDASYRYERGADIDILEYAVNRAASLIQEICGGEILQGIAESYPVPAAVKHITLRFERARALLGYDISNERIRDMMRRLSFTILTTDEESCSLTIPHYRIDVHTETDVIEEIAINVHYDAIPVQTFSRVPFDRQPLPIQYAVQSQSMRLKSILRYAGFNEILTQNQIDPQRTLNDEMTVHIANPLGQELSAMRDSLTPSMLTTARYNFRNGASSLRLFEVGNTFRLYNAGGDTLLQSDAIHLQEMLCLCIAGEAQSKEWYSQPRQSDVYDMIGVIDHIMKSLGADYSLQAIPEEYRSANSRYYSAESLAICHRDTIVGTLFMLSSEASSSFDIEKPVVLAEISLDVFNTAVNQERKYIPVSKYPMVQRDISLIVDQSITTAALLKTIRQSDAPIRRGERVFDVYSGKPIEEGKKSVSIALFYQSNERTLTDTEVDESVRVILNSLTEQHHAYLRA